MTLISEALRALPLLLLLVVVAIIATLSGCSAVGKPVAEKVADVVVKYCAEPYQARQLYRQTANAELATQGHRVTVHCAGDPEEGD